MSVKKAIIAFREKYKALPRKIIIYRGGVGEGDGDIAYIKEMEDGSEKSRAKSEGDVRSS